MTYLVKSPSDKFNGRTLGVQFNQGQAVLNQGALPKGVKIKDLITQFGRSPEQGGFGYTVKPLDKEAKEPAAA